MVIYNTDDKENLILEYIPLVKSVVAKIDGGNSGYEFEDLVNIGIIGLMDAIEKYDITRNVPFEAYARIRIRGSVIDELRKAGPVSRNRMEKLNEYYDAKKRLEHRLMRTPSEIEICNELGLSDNELSTIHETVHYLSGVSLESLIFSSEGNDTELKDMIEDDTVDLPEDQFSEKELSKALTNCISKLDKREQTLLSLYYLEEMTMKEIGYILDISVPRVSQIHGEIILKLKDLLKPYMEDI